MLKPSSLLRLVALALLTNAVVSGRHALMQAASLSHGTDVHRDDVMKPFSLLVDGNAVDLDRAASIMGMTAYSGSTQTARKEFEQGVRLRAMFFLTNDVETRVSDDIAENAVLGMAMAVVCVLAAIVVGIQARRLRVWPTGGDHSPGTSRSS